MVVKGIIQMEGVRVGILCKQNGKWYVMENVDFGYRKPFRYKQDAINAVLRWWKG